MSVLSAIVVLFLVIDPLGNIPLFVCALSTVDRRLHRRIIVRELLIALAILVMFLFAGNHILTLLGVSRSSLGIAGGIILLMIATKMVFLGSEMVFENAASGSPLVVPLAVPLVAGPSAITTVILLVSREPSRRPEWLLALFCAWLAAGIVLMFSGRLSMLLGNRGLKAIERLMGMTLATVAVEMFVTGIRQSFFN
ncbi:MAG: MarC family protein [Planctomycetota bacterium]